MTAIGTTKAKVTKKQCSLCRVTKPVSEFWKATSARDGFQSQCKACKNIGGKQSNIRRYGIELDQYDRLLAKQNGACAICRGHNANGYSLSVDHDHVTGEVRGLLCSKCNRGLGLLGDNILGLETAIKYLKGGE